MGFDGARRRAQPAGVGSRDVVFALGPYRPLNFGLRFSMKARRPSRKSSESMQAMPICLIAFMSRCSGSFNTCAMVILAALIASGALPEIVVAISIVAFHK